MGIVIASLIRSPKTVVMPREPILELPSPLSPSVPESDISVAMKKIHNVMDLDGVVYKDKV